MVEALAEKLAAETSKALPNGTIWNAVQLPEIQAMIALRRDEPSRSVELLASVNGIQEIRNREMCKSPIRE